MELPDQGAIDETTKSSQQESLSQAAPKRSRSESDLVEAALREKKVPTAQREAFGEKAGTISPHQAYGGGSQPGGAEKQHVSTHVGSAPFRNVATAPAGQDPGNPQSTKSAFLSPAGLRVSPVQSQQRTPMAPQRAPAAAHATKLLQSAKKMAPC